MRMLKPSFPIMMAGLLVAAAGVAWYSSQALAGAGGAASCALAPLAAAAEPAAKPAPAFTLPDTSGKPVSLADFAGRIVVLEWINPECPFVVRHYKAGTMAKLAEQYKDKGVVWLAINSTSHATTADNKKWIDQHNLIYPILDDHAGTVGKEYGAKTTPHMFVIKDGQIAYQGGIDDDPQGNKGAKASNHVAKALDELLAGQAVTTPQAKPYGCTVKYAK